MARVWTKPTLMTLLATVGCGAADVGTCPGGEENMGSMTATIDGSPFEACITTGSQADGVTSVIGQAYGDTLIPIQVQVTITENVPGTYELASLDSGHQGRYTDGLSADDTYNTFAEGNGTVTFDTLDASSAAGTFSFTARNEGGEVTITDGVFDVTF